jgi:integrase
MAQRRLPPGIVEHGAGYEAWVWSKQDGKKIRKQFSGKGALSAAKNWRADALKPVREGRLRAGDSRVTVKAWLEKWLEETAPQNASPRVVALYRHDVKTHIAPEVGHVRLVNLRRADCNALVTALFEKGLARTTIKRTLSPLRLALKKAVDEEKIGANPAASLEIPRKAPARKLHVPTLAEVNRILEKASEDGREAIVLVASLGLRKSELLALRWSDVDLKRNLVHVRRKNIGGLIEEGSKTEAGERTVPLYATARATLEARADRLGLQSKWLGKDERLIFANSRGGPFEPRNWSRQVWEPAREAAGLSDVRLHDLRHFNVTALRELGMASKLRSVVTGHSDERTTERIYDHVRPEHIEAAATAYDPLSGA